MVSDYKDDIINMINQTDEDPKSLINTLCQDKLKLLKEKKNLFHQLAEKDELLLKLTENYQKKWENICNFIKSVEELCHEMNISDSKLTELKDENRLFFDTQMDASVSSSSFFTVTENEDSNYTTSSESLVAANGTLKKNLQPKKEAYFSLNSLSNFHDFDKSDDEHFDHLQPSYLMANRPQSHCLQINNQLSTNIDIAISEPQFRIPDVPSPKVKRLIKKSSTVKSDRPNSNSEKAIPSGDKSLANYTDHDVLNWLLNVCRLPKVLIEDLKSKNKIASISMDQMTDQKLCKILGTNDKLIRKKVMLSLEETRSSNNTENIPDNDVSRKDHLWVANVWLKKHLGLGHLTQVFLSRYIDGRLLKFIATNTRQKELIYHATTAFNHLSAITILPSNKNKNTSEPSKSDMRSIRYGLELLTKFKFDLDELERRREACENSNVDVLVWTNERVSKWFQKMNLKSCIRGIEFSGIHGGLMVLDPQFSMATMSKLLEIPIEVVKKNNLDDKFSNLLKPSRFNEGVKNRRSTSIFQRRSFSQPRHSKTRPSRATSYKSSSTNADASDSASINDLPHSKAIYIEKSQTIDLSSSINQNFIRKYRKPSDDQQPKPVSTDTLIVPNNVSKSKISKSLAYSAQIPRKLITKSVSGSENSEDL